MLPRNITLNAKYVCMVCSRKEHDATKKYYLECKVCMVCSRKEHDATQEYERPESILIVNPLNMSRH